MAAKSKMTKQDREWRAKDDAYVLMQAEQIASDSQRKKAAIAAAKSMVREKEKDLKAIKKVTGKKK